MNAATDPDFSARPPHADGVDPMIDVYRRADRMLLVFLTTCFGAAVVLSLHFGGTALALAAGLPIVGLAGLLVAIAPGALVTRLYMAFALMAIIALQIQIARGMTDLHLGVFVSLAFLLAYRDWRPIVVAAGVIAAHHAGFNLLQQMGWGTVCFAEPSWVLDLDASHQGERAFHAGDIAREAVALAERCYAFFRWSVTDDFLTHFGGAP
jgi:methyl-accepting chemotaxis protein